MKEQKVNILHTIGSIVPQVFKVSPRLFLAFAAVALIHGLLWAVQITATQNAFDVLEATLRADTPLNAFWGALAILAGVMLLTQVFNALNSFVYTPYNRAVIGHFKRKIHAKLGRLSADRFEDQKTLELQNQAERGVENIFQLAFGVTMLFTFFLPYILYMLVWFYHISPVLSVLLVALSLPMLIFQRVKVKLFVNLEQESVAHRRRLEHYKNCIGAYSHFKETRLLGAYGFFHQLFSGELNTVLRLQTSQERKVALVQIADTVLTLVFYIGLLAYMIGLVAQDIMSVGTFAAIFASLTGLVDRIKETTALAGEFGRNVGPIHFYLDFMALDERAGTPEPLTEIGDIVLENTSYRYPGAKQDALRNVNLHIRKGETIAIVGENGAGKSTLVRLILGMYLPGEGKVTIGGRDTSMLPLDNAHGKMSGVFQKYQRYAMTARENVCIAQTNVEHSEAQVLAALQEAGFRLEALPDGLETMLSREFGGVDLSGGQWQRVAMARGLLRDHELIVLDEPTSAIDPIEETRVYEQFAQLARDKTAVLVTHRLGSARIADRIVVLHKGRIVETGTHEELLRGNTHYRAMYESQAQWYTASTP